MIALTQTARSELAGRIWKNSWFANETKLNAGVWQRIIFIAGVPIQDWVLAHLGCLVNKSCNLVSRVLLSWSQVQSQWCAGQLYHPDTYHTLASPDSHWECGLIQCVLRTSSPTPHNVWNNAIFMDDLSVHYMVQTVGVSGTTRCHILENVITLYYCISSTVIITEK